MVRTHLAVSVSLWHQERCINVRHWPGISTFFLLYRCLLIAQRTIHFLCAAPPYQSQSKESKRYAFFCGNTIRLSECRTPDQWTNMESLWDNLGPGYGLGKQTKRNITVIEGWINKIGNGLSGSRMMEQSLLCVFSLCSVDLHAFFTCTCMLTNQRRQCRSDVTAVKTRLWL